MTTQRTHYVEISEHVSERDPVPFSARTFLRPGRFESGRLYGPFTPNGAQKVAERALRAIRRDMPSEPWQGTFKGTGGQWLAHSTHGAYVVTNHDHMPYQYHGHVFARNLPADY